MSRLTASMNGRIQADVVLRVSGMLAGAGLAGVALWLIVTSHTQKRIEIGVLMGLWGALIAAFAAFGVRRHELAAPAAEIAVRPVAGPVGLTDDAAAFHAYEQQLRTMIRREVQQAFQEEVGSLRHEVAALRSDLVDKMGGQLRLERIETTRVIGSDIEALQEEVRQLQLARRAEAQALREAAREAIDAEIVHVAPVPAQPVQAQPVQAQPAQPVPAQPVQAQPVRAEAVPAEGVAEAVPAEAVPAEPAPAQRAAPVAEQPRLQWAPPPVAAATAPAPPATAPAPHAAAPAPPAEAPAQQDAERGEEFWPWGGEHGDHDAEHVQPEQGQDAEHGHAASHAAQEPVPFVPPVPNAPAGGQAGAPGPAGDPFAGMPRIRPFTDFELDPAGTAADLPTTQQPAYGGGRHAGADPANQPRAGGRRRREDEDDDVLASILKRERANRPPA